MGYIFMSVYLLRSLSTRVYDMQKVGWAEKPSVACSTQTEPTITFSEPKNFLRILEPNSHANIRSPEPQCGTQIDAYPIWAIYKQYVTLLFHLQLTRPIACRTTTTCMQKILRVWALFLRSDRHFQRRHGHKYVLCIYQNCQREFLIFLSHIPNGLLWKTI